MVTHGSQMEVRNFNLASSRSTLRLETCILEKKFSCPESFRLLRDESEPKTQISAIIYGPSSSLVVDGVEKGTDVLLRVRREGEEISVKCYGEA